MKSNLNRFWLILIAFGVFYSAPECQSSANTFTGLHRPYVNRGCDDLSQALKNVWGLGTIGQTCRASSLGNSLLANLYYSDFMVKGSEMTMNANNVLDDQGKSYITKYGINIANLIDQMAYEFLKSREVLEKSARDNKPISDEEMRAWVLFVKIIGFQESMFTHYQLDDRLPGDEVDQLKILVGDQAFGKTDSLGRPIFHSKGMFQILSSLQSEISKENFDLILNINNGMKHVYNHWNRLIGIAPMSRSLAGIFSQCRARIYNKNKSINYDNVIRAAYGMYNGGDGAICRFHKSEKRRSELEKNGLICKPNKITPQCKAAQMCRMYACPWVVDSRIANFIKNRPWEERLKLTDLERSIQFKTVNGRFEFPFDLNCMKEEGRFCLKKNHAEENLAHFLTGNLSNRLFTFDNQAVQAGKIENSYCVYDKKQQNFVCTSQQSLVPCLRNIQNFPMEKIMKNKAVQRAYFSVYELPESALKTPPLFVEDPKVLCKGSIDGVFTPGQMIELKQDSVVFKDKNSKSKRIGRALKGKIVQVLDFDLSVSKSLDRWYKIPTEDKNGKYIEGYIYGGNDLSWANSIQISSTETGNIDNSPYRENQIIPDVGQTVKFERSLKTFSVLPKGSDILEPGQGPVLEGELAKVLGIHIVGAAQEIYLKLKTENHSEPVYVRVGQMKTNANSIKFSIEQNVRIVHGAAEK